MSALEYFHRLSAPVQLMTFIASAVIAGFGVGVAVAQRPDLQPMIEANTMAIDSLRTRSVTTEAALRDLVKEVRMISCVTRAQLTDGIALACLP